MLIINACVLKSKLLQKFIALFAAYNITDSQNIYKNKMMMIIFNISIAPVQEM